MNWDFWQRNDFVREPVIFGVAFCVADQVYNPTSGALLPFNKQTLTYVILGIDFTCILITVLFIGLL
jgi:hypothetical protein